MNTTKRTSQNIEILEPLLLMSASAIEAEPIEVACGAEMTEAAMIQDADDADFAAGSVVGGISDIADPGVANDVFSVEDRITDVAAPEAEITSVAELTVAAEEVMNVVEGNGQVQEVDVLSLADIDAEATVENTTPESLTEDVWFPEAAESESTALQEILPVCEKEVIFTQNADPQAADDSVTTVESMPVSGSVAENDGDADGDVLTFHIEDGPQHGSIEFSEDGSYTYTPDPGYSGHDCFSYEVSDGNGGTDYAEVNIEVTAVVNEGPVAENDSNATAEGVAVSGSVAGNDSDPEGDQLTFYVDEGPTNGSIEFAEDGTYTYTPDPGFVGEDSFTYEAADGNGGTVIATVAIVVNPAPIQAPDAVMDHNTTDYGTAVSGTLLCNDVAPDSDQLTATLTTGPQNGTAVVNADGSYTYTPNDGFSGTDMFVYEVSDGNGGTDTAEVCIEVGTPPNNAVDAADDAYTTEANTAVKANVLVNDVDPDGDSLTVASQTGVATAEGGVVTVNGDGTFEYVPANGFSGVDTFTYAVDDGNGSTETATVTITVNKAPNNAVDAADDAYTTEANTAVKANVLVNDVDPDGDSLTVASQTGVATAEGGVVTVNGDGTFEYVPANGFSGVDTFTYAVDDGNGSTETATVTITVNKAPNNAVDAADDAYTTEANTAVKANVLVNDVDPDGDSLTVASQTGVATAEGGVVTVNGDGTFEYVPANGFSGVDTFTYAVDDGNGSTETATVTITVNKAPNNAVDAADDEYTTDEDTSVSGNVLSNDVDPDGDAIAAAPLTDVQTSEGGIVTLHADGSFAYMPADGFSGVDTFTYSANDGNGSTASATVTIVVKDVPEPPKNDAFDGDNGECIKGNVIINDGGDLSQASVTIVEGPANGTLTLNADGTFCYLSNDGYSGNDTFSYSIVRAGVVGGVGTVRLVVADVQYDTTYVAASTNGRIWGDPHFEGDDGGLYDVQGEAGHIYSLLSDRNLQVNALYVPWEGHPGSTMMGQIGATVGSDLVLADETGTFVNGVAVAAGGTVAIEGGQVEYDGEFTTITTGEYKLKLNRRDGWYDMQLDALNPFGDNVAPHGLWGLTVDGDSEARHGDFFKTHGWDYTLQGGGAIDTVDTNGNVVVTKTGDRNAYGLYETANLFSTEALNDEGEVFFRFNARQGTGLARL